MNVEVTGIIQTSVYICGITTFALESKISLSVRVCVCVRVAVGGERGGGSDGRCVKVDGTWDIRFNPTVQLPEHRFAH